MDGIVETNKSANPKDQSLVNMIRVLNAKKEKKKEKGKKVREREEERDRTFSNLIISRIERSCKSGDDLLITVAGSSKRRQCNVTTSQM